MNDYDFKGKTKNAPFDAYTFVKYKYTLGDETSECGEVELEWCKKSCRCCYGCTVQYEKATFKASLNQHRSWVKAGQATETLLAHERLHVWIAEKAANEGQKRIRKVVGKGADCTEKAALKAAQNEAKSQMKEIVDHAKDVADVVNERYDTQTNHNLNGVQQARWQQTFETEVESAW